MKGEHAVRLQCKLLGVATGGYYRWRKGGSSQRQCEDAAITKQIVVAHEASRGTYGVPRILEDLRDAGTRTSKRRCGRLMRAVGLRGRKKHASQPRTTFKDWRKLLQSGQESLSQALGRAAASTGASGLLVRSTAVHQAHNVILFPPLGGSDRLNIIEGDALARLTVGKKP